MTIIEEGLNLLVGKTNENERTAIETLLRYVDFTPHENAHIEALALELTSQVRSKRLKHSSIDAFIAEYSLSNEEGLALMCLAEALLRIPDKATQERLIRDKICRADWAMHLGKSGSFFVNAASVGLYVGSRLIDQKSFVQKTIENGLKQFIKRNSMHVLRHAVRYAMRVLGNYFVMGETINDALARAMKNEARGYRYSYDMLGEEAKTHKDALIYFQSYKDAIHTLGQSQTKKLDFFARASISIKLSALHPRYDFKQQERVMDELLPRVKELCQLAAHYGLCVTIDAEETERLVLSLKLIEALALDPDLAHWQGLGLAVQAYQKRAFYVLDYLKELSIQSKRRFMVRLVKGAYWDGEIKRAQDSGLIDYPVFTRKVYTDVSYLACAKKLLANPEHFYSQFATHNAQSVAAVLELAKTYRDFEFQCLHGMGTPLYDQLVDKAGSLGIPCRIYAPVGSHEYLLAYLVRRLLENGANSSFVNQILDTSLPLSTLITNPLERAKALQGASNPNIPLPKQLYGEKRMNAMGLDLNNPHTVAVLMNELYEASRNPWLALPMIADEVNFQTTGKALYNPAKMSEMIGHVIETEPKHVELAISRAVAAFPSWSNTPAASRAELLRRAADLLETNFSRFMALAIKEAGKSIPNAISEVREAIDFCRYYAEQAETHFAKPQQLRGITGETNELELHGRGVIACISPWNFPLAIFLGGVSAALAAGNTVIAKPAEQTPLIASAAIDLLYQAGIPRDVVQMLPGKGEIIGAKLTQDERIAGVIFTGSTETAHAINRSLAARKGQIVPLIAETGGQNALVVDSSALSEQVVTDVLQSSFDSAGQRCSALRVLFLQNDIADKVLDMLTGAMDELRVGNPSLLSTDVGPVIDEEAKTHLLNHIEAMRKNAKVLHQVTLSQDAALGHFVAPTLIEIPDIALLKREVFGPILHVIRFAQNQLPQVVTQINSTGYGLTFGIHSRINETIDYLRTHVQAGNVYVNRNLIGAVVGVQPFGGQGMSGTGPKAGGPYYLPRLAIERVVTINTSASGGNAALMRLKD